MFSTISPTADEELMEAMAKQVVEYLKEPRSSTVRVGGWSGIGNRRVMDRVAAAALALCDRKKKKNKGEENEDSSSSSSSSFCGCVRVTYKSYIPLEYEIRRTAEQVLGMPLPGGEEIYWREICVALKWKPLVLIVDNLQGGEQLEERALGIPKFVRDTGGVEHSFLKLVFANPPRWYGIYREFKGEFGELPDDVALRMILYEARSSAMSTVKEYLPDVIRRKFTSRQEGTTSMMLPSLAPLHDDLFGMLTAECVLQCLLSLMLFSSGGCPLYYLSSEILSHPCFDNYNNNETMINSWEAKLLLEALSQDLLDRRLMNYREGEGTFCIFPNVYHKLAASAASSSSSSGIMTQFHGYFVRRSIRLKRVDMAEWCQDLTRTSMLLLLLLE